MTGIVVPFSATTPYLNTIRPEQQTPHPGDRIIEHRIRSLVRWNAIAIIMRANKASSELGGHIASFQSAATLYDAGFMHFWHGATESPWRRSCVYAGTFLPRFLRSRLPGRPTERGSSCSASVRRSTGGGLSSYPHPWLMPDFWQFPTVSMGLGPLMAIYQARFLKYLHDRGLADTTSARSGASSAMARRMSPKASARSPWRRASGSTT